MDDKHAVAVGVVFGAGALGVGWVLPNIAPAIPLISSWCIFAAGGMLILLSVMGIIRPQWFRRRARSQQPPFIAPISPPVEHSTRIKYSSSQAINSSGGGAINLDNAGRLIASGGSNLEGIEMRLVNRPTVSIPNIPVQGISGFHLTHIDADSKEFSFTAQNPSHLIETGNRRFLVTLVEIEDQSTRQRRNYCKYSFAISEQ